MTHASTEVDAHLKRSACCRESKSVIRFPCVPRLLKHSQRSQPVRRIWTVTKVSNENIICSPYLILKVIFCKLNMNDFRGQLTETACYFSSRAWVMTGFLRCAAPAPFHAPMWAVWHAGTAVRTGVDMDVIYYLDVILLFNVWMLFTIWTGLNCLSLVLSHRKLSSPNSLDLRTAQNGHTLAQPVRRAATARGA